MSCNLAIYNKNRFIERGTCTYFNDIPAVLRELMSEHAVYPSRLPVYRTLGADPPE